MRHFHKIRKFESPYGKKFVLPTYLYLRLFPRHSYPLNFYKLPWR